MLFENFKSKWNNMSSIPYGYLNLGVIHPLDIQIGYYENEIKSLVIMDTEVVPKIQSSFVVKVCNTQIKKDRWILEFQLMHSSYEEVFLRLCWDIIEVSRNSSEPLKKLISRYMSWQKLLQNYSDGVMSFQRQKGLIGELLYLRQKMNEQGVGISIEAWVGSDGGDQDFVFSNMWTEIKTVALSATSVSISSLEQLEQEIEGVLKIYTLEKTTKGEGRISVNKLVQEIRKELTREVGYLDIFEMKLYKYGYRDSDKDEYEKNQFRLIGSREYEVTDQFPKLVKANVANEIVECKYILSLVGIEKFRRN